MYSRFLLISWRWIGITLSSMVLCLGCASPQMACPLSPPPRIDLPELGISAHRGGLLGCPVNTVGAFRRAICRGVHQIELDVRVTADNVIVVAHDDQMIGTKHSLHLSESSLDQIRKVELPSCTGVYEEPEHIPTLEEALTVMPENIWINIDIKGNDPNVAKLVAETVFKAHRSDQVIFAARDKAVPVIRQLAKEAQQNSMIANMSRKIFRSQYVESTINSCAEFIQLVKVPYVPFARGKPSTDTMKRLNEGGIRVNYSWLRGKKEEELKRDLEDLFSRGVDFVLVDHVEQAMNAAEALGILPVVPRWDRASQKTDHQFPYCSPTE